jgi:hypothetical protein
LFSFKRRLNATRCKAQQLDVASRRSILSGYELKTVDDAQIARAFITTFSLTALSSNGGFHDQIAV